MARSSGIWLVSRLNGPTIAGFTVKHEMVTFLERRDVADLTVQKVADGHEEFSQRVSAQDFLDGYQKTPDKHPESP